MAFDEHTNMVSITQEEGEHEDYHRNQHHSLSRLSICTNYEAEEKGYQEDNNDEYDAGDDADGELSDSDKTAGKRGEARADRTMELDFSDSDKELDCHSLPATPPRRRRRNLRGDGVHVTNSPVSGDKAYASENEVRKAKQGNPRRRSKCIRNYPPWVGSMRRSYEANIDHGEESDHGGHGGGGVVVVTRPVGGGRPLCMDLEEVKACKDLGFELEPGRVSYSAGSTMDTSSGGNSPTNWRISSPGDDPRDVKARLKAWAHAVAFVSTARRSTT